MTSAVYWFNGFANLVDVFGFESLSGVTNMAQTFTSCSSLEKIWAYVFTNAITSSASTFYRCNRLVGGYDGFVSSSTSAESVCKLGAGGVILGYSYRAKFRTVSVQADMGTLSAVNMNYWFYGLSAITSFVGLGNLVNVVSMRYAFTSSRG